MLGTKSSECDKSRTGWLSSFFCFKMSSWQAMSHARCGNSNCGQRLLYSAEVRVVSGQPWKTHAILFEMPWLYRRLRREIAEFKFYVNTKFYLFLVALEENGYYFLDEPHMCPQNSCSQFSQKILFLWKKLSNKKIPSI